jgi:hypothetical protein
MKYARCKINTERRKEGRGIRVRDETGSSRIELE